MEEPASQAVEFNQNSHLKAPGSSTASQRAITPPGTPASTIPIFVAPTPSSPSEAYSCTSPEAARQKKSTKSPIKSTM